MATQLRLTCPSEAQELVTEDCDAMNIHSMAHTGWFCARETCHKHTTRRPGAATQNPYGRQTRPPRQRHIDATVLESPARKDAGAKHAATRHTARRERSAVRCGN
jgi:hypothetical protein